LLKSSELTRILSITGQIFSGYFEEYLVFLARFWKIFIIILRFFAEPLAGIFGVKIWFRGILVVERLSRIFTPKFLCHPIDSSFCFQDAQNLNQQRVRDEPYYLWVRNNLAEYPNLFKRPVMCKHWYEQIYLNLGVRNKNKLPTFTELGTICTHMF
jgi:hypothetical protein